MINQPTNGTFVNKIILLIIVLVITSLIVFSAKWVPLVEKNNWDYSSQGSCTQTSSCFVMKGDETKDTSTDYYKKLNPQCINNEDYIEDYYCDNGRWSTRTKLLALELVNIADRESASKYDLFCGLIDDVSLKSSQLSVTFKKEQTSIPRVSTGCVLNYDKGIALAMSVNSPINDQFKSPLLDLNVKEDHCNNALTSTSFEKCTGGTLTEHDIYYNNKIQGLIYLPKTSSLQSFNLQQFFVKFFENPFKTISDYSKNYQMNSFFSQTNLFQNVYIAKSSSTSVFGFLETRTENKNKLTYLGIKYSGTGMNDNTCSSILKPVMTDVKCLNQAGGEFTLVGTAASVTNYWKELTAGLRLK